jgi:hypothetical protein
MALRPKEFTTGEKVKHDGETVTVVEKYLDQPRGTINVRNKFGYVVTVKAKDLKKLD